MLSEAQQKRVWEGMLGSEIHAKYFADFSGRYIRRQQVGTWFTLLFASFNIVTLLATIPSNLQWIRSALAAVASAASVYLALANNKGKALECSKLHERWSHLSQSYRGIWENIDLENGAALLKDLDSQQTQLSNLGIPIQYSKKAMTKWQDHTEHEYGVGSLA